MKKLKLVLASLTFLSVLVVPTFASADVNDFVITSFTADETLTRTDPQGELRVIERINVDFHDYNHGILRAIPKRYKNHSLQLRVNKVSSDSNAPAQFTTYSSNGNTVLKIGDPAYTVTGQQEYTIDYTLRNVISFYDDHDELFWDVNGDQWSQQFSQVTTSLHLPSDLKQKNQPICFTGFYGNKDQKCEVKSQPNKLTFQTTEALIPRQTLTYVVGFEKGYFKPSTWFDTLQEYKETLVSLLVPLVFLGGGSCLIWYIWGRDPRGSVVIIPHYESPEGLKPLEVGSIIDFQVDNRDISATIIDLAIRRYIKIIEKHEELKWAPDNTIYRLQLLNADYSKLTDDEQLLMSKLFIKQEVGEEMKLKDNVSKLYNVAKKLRKNVKDRMIANGYFKHRRMFIGTTPGHVLKSILSAFLPLIFFIFWSLLWITSLNDNFHLNLPFVIGTILGALLALIFILALNARTAKGVAAKESVLGLKLYLTTAEKDRIAKLQAPNAPYAPQASEPERTVELFEKLLPYAVALGVEKEWSKQFEDLYTTPPDWYAGNWNNFNTGYFAGSLSDGIGSAVNSSFSAPSSSGGSGFGGGGGAGGGGGGGGGGGW